MQRVMIIGGPGAGKTWLAKQIASQRGLPVIAIDDLVHDAAGLQRSDTEIDADALAATLTNRWVIEGGNSRTYGARVDRADWLIRLRPPVAVRLYRVVRRGGATLDLLRWTMDYDSIFGPRDDAIVSAARGRIKVSDVRSNRDVAALF